MSTNKPDSRLEEQLRGKQIELLFDQSVTVIPVMLAIAMVSVIAYWDMLDKNLLINWLIGIMLVGMAGLAGALRYKKLAPPDSQNAPWLMLFLVGNFIIACLWEGLAFMIVSQLALSDAAVILLVLIGLAAGSSAYMVVLKRAYLIVLTPYLAPIGLFLITSGQGSAHLAGWAMMTVFGFLLMTSLRPHHALRDGLLLHFENNSLLRQLEHEKRETERLNEQLNRDIDEKREKEQALKDARDQAERLVKQLERFSSQDGLTGIANRRRMDETLRVEWSRSLREQMPLSMILCNIDHFKHLNDIIGHKEADACLQRIARLLDNFCRRGSDLAARYDGDEFALILPNTEHRHAIALAEQLRREIETLEIEHDQNPQSDRLTMSFGVSTAIANEHLSAAILIANADKALQTAKNEGRNRIASSCETMS